jgi:ACS family hexuronate transporter-like MFS transporter
MEHFPMHARLTFGLPYSRMKWVIAVWLALSTVLNVVDKQTLSILAPWLRDQFHLSIQGYSNVVTAFMISFTVMYTVGGRLVDWLGERVAMAACICWWSICTILTGFAQGAVSLGAVRFLLGLGEPGNYPAALRATTRWFPQADRGLPIALFSSGGALGNVIAPPLIAALAIGFGWRAAFFVPGALGLLWLAGWLAIYRLPSEYPGIRREEIQQLEGEKNIPSIGFGQWAALLKDRNVLALLLARLVSDPAWYFYVFWIPEYLRRERGFSLSDIGMYAWIPFVAGAIGGVLGGRASDVLIRRGVAPVKARSLILYSAAAIAPLGILTNRVHSASTAIALIAVMAFVAYTWFINTAAMIPDVVGQDVVGSVLGFIGTAGSAGGVLFTPLVGYLVSHDSYSVVFLIVGSMHLTGALIIRLFRMSPKTAAPASEVIHAA